MAVSPACQLLSAPRGHSTGLAPPETASQPLSVTGSAAALEAPPLAPASGGKRAGKRAPLLGLSMTRPCRRCPCCPSVMTSCRCCAQVAECFSGFKSTTCVAQWSDRMYYKTVDAKRPGPETGPCRSVCSFIAVGCLDGLITLHQAPNKSKAVVILDQCFNQAVTDISWHPSGKALLACSKDGTILKVMLESAITGQVSLGLCFAGTAPSLCEPLSQGHARVQTNCCWSAATNRGHQPPSAKGFDCCCCCCYCCSQKGWAHKSS